jgi:hypothetical protein
VALIDEDTDRGGSVSLNWIWNLPGSDKNYSSIALQRILVTGKQIY